MGKVTKNAIDKEFEGQVRQMLQPGTSALFTVVEKVTPDKAVEALSKYGGTVLKSSLSSEAQHDLLQDTLHGQTPPRDYHSFDSSPFTGWPCPWRSALDP
jgi:uncharacterized membrane protein